jgi:hypothetical protein
MFASFFVSGVDSKADFQEESSTATLRSRLSIEQTEPALASSTGSRW